MNLAWTPDITANVTAQRASKRKKSVGGAFDTTGFTPTNNMGTGVSSATTTVLNNIIYEFKVENLCITGGPTINSNGVIEQIKFACIIPQITVSGTTININVPLTGTDITKVRYILKKQSDSSTVDTQIVVRVANNTPYSFTGLDASTGYYFTIELYTTLITGEVLSSGGGYIGIPCGGNITGYQATTSIVVVTCTEYINSTPSPIINLDFTLCGESTLTENYVLNPGGSICVIDGSLVNGESLTVVGVCDAIPVVEIAGTMEHTARTVSVNVDTAIPCTIIFPVSGIYDETGPHSFAGVISISSGSTSGSSGTSGLDVPLGGVITCITPTVGGGTTVLITRLCLGVNYNYTFTIDTPC